MSDDLFDAPEDGEPQPRKRKPNASEGRRAPLCIVLTFTRQELRSMKHNTPGPSGKIGGWPIFENWVIENTDPETFECVFDPVPFMRLIIYLKSYKDGGPNRRVRGACTPALERIGIIVKPGWVNPWAPLPAPLVE